MSNDTAPRWCSSCYRIFPVPIAEAAMETTLICPHCGSLCANRVIRPGDPRLKLK